MDKEAVHSMNEETELNKDLKINSANLVDIILKPRSEYDIEIRCRIPQRRYIHAGNCIDVILEKMKEKI
jgi:acyl carrier protein